MKQPQLQISIPEPCHENWNEMSPTEKGRFCKVCTKEVIDFTSKSDEEIINHVKKHNNACGRFYPSQLNRKLIADRKKRNHWLSYAASLLLPMTLFSQEKTADKKQTPKTEQNDATSYKSLQIGTHHNKTAVQKERISLKGIVLDESGLPLPSASIYLKRTNKGVTTDFDGKFELEVQKGDEIVCSFVGYASQKIKITSATITIQMQDMCELEMLGEVVTDTNRYKSSFTQKVTEKVTDQKLRVQNYFAFQRKKWLEKRAKRKAARIARKLKKHN